MSKYSVIASYYASINVEVEAKDAEEAMDKGAEAAKTKESYDEAAGDIQFDEVHSPELIAIAK